VNSQRLLGIHDDTTEAIVTLTEERYSSYGNERNSEFIGDLF
jgi:hypothetical protein